jgi:uncharacterized protein YndB with AHSA1/START domain
MQKEIRQTWHFNQSPQEVWEYLTKPELIEQWLMPNDFQPIVGHKFRFVISQGKDGKSATIQHYCEVLELIPYKKLSYSWKKDDMSLNSKVSWTLIPKGNGTELQLVHNGFAELEAFISHNNGWPIVGSRLVELLNIIKK